MPVRPVSIIGNPVQSIQDDAVITGAIGRVRETVREHPEQAETVRLTLRGLLPSVAEALGGSGEDGPDIDRLGVSIDEVRQFALDGLTRRLDIIGVPLSSVY